MKKIRLLFCLLLLLGILCGCAKTADMKSLESNNTEEAYSASPTTEPNTPPEPSSDAPNYLLLPDGTYLDIAKLSFKEKTLKTYCGEDNEVSVSVVVTTVGIRGLGSVQYDKPVVSGDTKAAAKINEMFGERENNFFFARENALYFREYCGEYGVTNALTAKNICGVMHSADITYFKNNILSVRERLYWPVFGHNFFGATVDITTGDLIPLSYFIKEDIDGFNDMVIAKISRDLSHHTDYFDAEETKNKIWNYRSLENYEYFYDGYKIHLVFREIDDLNMSLSGVKGQYAYVMQIDIEP